MPKENQIVQTRFKDLLHDHRNGGMEFEMSQQIKELVEAVRATAKGGSITLKISIAPINGDPKKVVMIDEIKSNIPQTPKGGSLFWTTDLGGLVNRNPDQLELVERQQ